VTNYLVSPTTIIADKASPALNFDLQIAEQPVDCRP